MSPTTSNPCSAQVPAGTSPIIATFLPSAVERTKVLSLTLVGQPGVGGVQSSPHDYVAAAGWSGACGGASTTCTVTMSQARSVTANLNAF